MIYYFIGHQMRKRDKIQSILNTYKRGSSQMINKQESSLYFSSNTRENTKFEVMHEVGGALCGGNYDMQRCQYIDPIS